MTRDVTHFERLSAWTENDMKPAVGKLLRGEGLPAEARESNHPSPWISRSLRNWTVPWSRLRKRSASRPARSCARPCPNGWGATDSQPRATIRSGSTPRFNVRWAAGCGAAAVTGGCPERRLRAAQSGRARPPEDWAAMPSPREVMQTVFSRRNTCCNWYPRSGNRSSWH